MKQQNIPIGTLVEMYKRGEMRLPETRRHYVWRGTRVCDLLDSLYRGYPSGSMAARWLPGAAPANCNIEEPLS